MSWPDVFLVFLVSHLVGDFVLQTDWQARNKHGGLGRDPVARRALLSHGLTYTLAFAPAIAWIVANTSPAALLLAPLIGIPHVVQDDGRLLSGFMRRVKGVESTTEWFVVLATDQS